MEYKKTIFKTKQCLETRGDSMKNCMCTRKEFVVEINFPLEQFIENFSLIDSDRLAWMELYQCKVCGQFWAIERGSEFDRRNSLAFKITQVQSWKTFDFASAKDNWRAQKYGGISQNQCMYKGCDNFAVKGKVFCLKHLT